METFLPTARPGIPPVPGSNKLALIQKAPVTPDEITFLLSRLTTTLLQPSSREQFLIHSFFGTTIETGSLVSNPYLQEINCHSFFGTPRLDRKSTSQLGLPGLLNRDQHPAVLTWTNQINLHGKDPLASTHSTGPELVPPFHL